MKKIVASVGLVAVGASGLQAALLPALTEDSGKPWSLSATLRGFYDDNINCLPDNANIAHRSTTGFELSPSLQFSFPMDQTTLDFGYVYSYKYYTYQPVDNTDHYDQTHDFHVDLTHAFSERYQISVKESFVIGQEPDFLRAGNTYTTFQRISGDNLRNYGVVDLSAQLTPEWGIDVGYENTFYSYSDNAYSGIYLPTTPPTLYSITPSNSGLLDEIDNLIRLDLRYQLQPETIGVLGYQFRDTEYIGNQPIGINYTANQLIMSDARNAESHYVYIGLDHNFRPDLTGSVRAGGRYTDYYNDPSSQNEFSPYAMASLQYTYMPESTLTFGFSYDYSPSSVFSVDSSNGEITLNAQSATVYANLHHRITPKLFGNILAQYQNSTMYGGTYNNEALNYYLVGLNLQYVFTPNFSAEVGYNYDDFNSEVAAEPSYNRNRVYIGVTGTY